MDDGRSSYLTRQSIELGDMSIRVRESALFDPSPVSRDKYASLDRESVLYDSGAKSNLPFSYIQEADDTRIDQSVDRLRFYAEKYNS